MGGDWEGIMRRLGNEELIAKLSLKFLSSKEYFDIGDAIRNHDWEKAFVYPHSEGCGSEPGICGTGQSNFHTYGTPEKQKG